MLISAILSVCWRALAYSGAPHHASCYGVTEQRTASFGLCPFSNRPGASQAEGKERSNPKGPSRRNDAVIRPSTLASDRTTSPIRLRNRRSLLHPSHQDGTSSALLGGALWLPPARQRPYRGDRDGAHMDKLADVVHRPPHSDVTGVLPRPAAQHTTMEDTYRPARRRNGGSRNIHVPF